MTQYTLSRENHGSAPRPLQMFKTERFQMPHTRCDHAPRGTFPMKRPHGLLSLLLLLVTTVASAVEQPNIVIFYVDDLGWQDVQLNDLGEPCPYDTPNLVRLAESGMNFTEAYSPAPTCSPSRAGILTGQHPARLGLTHVTLGSTKKPKKNVRLVDPYLDVHLDMDALTLADAMKSNGYRTGHSGKWHVGQTAASYGFEVVDQDRGFHRSMGDRTKDFATAKDKKYPLSEEKYPPFSDKKPNGISYPYDQVTESAITFMAESQDQPFFLNLCHWMVHWPVLTRNGELLEYYCDKMGQPFPPKPGDMTLKGQQNPYFGAMVTSVDWSLGRIVDFLKTTDDPRHPGKKLSETTYIFFTSDNGGAEKRGKEVISDNYPLKYGKSHAEEGGVRIPMVIAGPGVSQASQFDGLVNQLDFFPTILQLTGSTIEADAQQKLSGLDIAPVLTQQSQKIVDAAGAERDHLFWHFPHGGDSMKSAIRSGDYKLYKRYESGDYELYQLYENGERKDIEEENNLAEKPEFKSVVTRLAATLDADLAANDAQGPYLNPAYAERTSDPASIEGSVFEATSREARLSLKASGPGITQASVVYLLESGATGEKRRSAKKQKKAKDKSPATGIKMPAVISEDGRSVTAAIPEGVAAYRFIVIDSNNFQTYSDVEHAK